MVAKVKGFARSHPFVLAVCILVMVGAASAAWVITSIYRIDSTVVYFGVPDAPQLTAGPGETLYRINASRSTATYTIEEQLAGASNTATGSTKGIAGDIAVNEADPSASRVGEMVVNVQQLTSDERVRDERIRHEGLQSNDYPLARLTTTSVEGLPTEIVDGTDYAVRLHGDLTVKTTTAPVTFEGTVRRDKAELQISVSTELRLSTFDAGPITLVGLVSTSDEVTLELDLVAVDPATLGDQSRLAWQQATGPAPSGEGPSFRTVVQPILEQRCAGCHAPGEAGSTIWQLETARDAASIASGLGLVTRTRYMPPWPASEESVPFEHSMRLSDDELSSLLAWSQAGGPLDVAPGTPVEPAENAVVHPRADLVLRADEPYQGSTELTNDYRCFVLDPELREPAVVTGYEFVPDQKRYVHHALVYKMDADELEAVRARDAAEEGSGYTCYGGVGSDDGSLDPSGSGGGAALVAGWAPGQLPGIYPDGAGLHLEPGEFFVVQIHYHFVHVAPPDHSSLVVELAEGDLDAYDDIRVTTYLAPAEIPCGPTESGPLCERAAVIDQLVGVYGPTAAFIADGLHVVCGGTSPFDVVLRDGRASSSCDHRVRRPGEILSVLGHMHEIGATYRMTLNPGTPGEKVLLHIPNWDFNWQLNYDPVETIELQRGDVIRVECSWDRARLKPNARNRWVTWSEGTEDEMCFSTVVTRETRE